MPWSTEHWQICRIQTVKVHVRFVLNTMAQTKRSSMKSSDRTADDQLGQLNELENVIRRKSVYPFPLGRRRSSLFSGHMAETPLSRKFSRKFSKFDLAPRHINYEATYRTEPVIKFHVATVQKVIKDTLTELLEDFQYSAVGCSTVSRTVVEEIKHRVKLLGYDRYKIVVVVVVGEMKNQGVLVTSRCAWEPMFDDYATCTYQNKAVFGSAQVFGIYMD
ncbi:dynein light chain Tctex-type 5-like [Gigantopelta aegis]|uniref:dynein light chain Tctex-type 5-like n=1 Tax=Gigantopelta aegis TaxID=1735272 RepID=UPI001B88A494|nr:dynein light chain Tctex-type 5-like [Gigantopelta aegis]